MCKKLILAKNKIKNVVKWFGCTLRRKIFQLHIYQTFDETKFKAPVFIISFMASLFCYNKASSLAMDDVQTNVTVGWAALLYGLALVSEVWMLLKNDECFTEKLFKGIIYWDGVVAIVLGIYLISVQKSCIPTDYVIAVCGISAVVFFIDALLFHWVRPPETYLNSQEDALKEMEVGGSEK